MMLLSTRSGAAHSPMAPRAKDIHLEDIAVALSRLCRWNGHLTAFYSVAQHSVLVSQLCRPEDALWGLLHDAPEAFLGDLARPLKALPALSGYRMIEVVWHAAIAQRFGLPVELPASVTAADELVLHWEQRDLTNRPCDLSRHPDLAVLPPLVPLRPVQAEQLFLARFEELGGVRE